MKRFTSILLFGAFLIVCGTVSGVFDSEPVQASYPENDYMGAILHIDTTLTASDTAIGSVATLLGAPAVREVSATFTAAQNVTLTGHLTRCTYPQAITPTLDGCVAAYWIVDFSSWDGNVMFKTIIGATGTADPDTAFYTPPLDTLYVLEGDFGGTREGLVIPITNFDGGYLAGYPYLQMQTRTDVTNIDSLYIYLVRVF